MDAWPPPLPFPSGAFRSRRRGRPRRFVYGGILHSVMHSQFDSVVLRICIGLVAVVSPRRLWFVSVV